MEYEQIIPGLIKYFNGHCDNEEIAFLNRWLAESPDNIRLFNETRDIWFAVPMKGSSQPFNSLEALINVRKRINENSLKIPVAKGIIFKKIFRIAAAILILLGSILTTYLFSIRKEVIDKSVTEIFVPLGSKSRINLPDGTRVWLNSGTSIHFRNDFAKASREVTMEGEAFFDVKHNQKLPFIVHTSNINIKVLGTAFNVKAYPAEGSIETTLVRGSLLVEQKSSVKGTQKTLLAPNERATYFKETGNLYLSETDQKVIKEQKISEVSQLKGKVLIGKKIETDVFTSWKDNKLIFKNETFGNLSVKLERWYGVKFSIQDEEILNYHFNGTIENETIQDVMVFINYMHPIRYKIEHNVITIYKSN
jgi:transmembrane sensor